MDVDGGILRGWALAEQGQQSKGIEQMRQGLSQLRETRAGLWRPSFLALLANACGKAGSSDQAFALLEEGQTVALRNGERFYKPELCRLKGELLLTGGQDNRRGAELCFQEALRIAKGQDAKALELRAALSLGRLSAKQGRCSEARDLLTPIVDWFTRRPRHAGLEGSTSAPRRGGPNTRNEVTILAKVHWLLVVHGRLRSSCCMVYGGSPAFVNASQSNG